jgi:hypothetical protein
MWRRGRTVLARVVIGRMPCAGPASNYGRKGHGHSSQVGARRARLAGSRPLDRSVLGRITEVEQVAFTVTQVCLSDHPPATFVSEGAVDDSGVVTYTYLAAEDPDADGA